MIASKPTRKIAPPVKAPIAGPIRALKVGESVLIHADHTVVKSRLSQIRKEDKTRSYTSKREGTGVRVWRLA